MVGIPGFLKIPIIPAVRMYFGYVCEMMHKTSRIFQSDWMNGTTLKKLYFSQLKQSAETNNISHCHMSCHLFLCLVIVQDVPSLLCLLSETLYTWYDVWLSERKLFLLYFRLWNFDFKKHFIKCLAHTERREVIWALKHCFIGLLTYWRQTVSFICSN